MQRSETIDSKLISAYCVVLHCCWWQLRIWARSDEKNCIARTRTHTCRSRALGVSNDGDVHLSSIEMYSFMNKNFGGVRDRGWLQEYTYD